MRPTWLAIAAMVAIAGACKDKKSKQDGDGKPSAVDVEGLGAVPGDARAVIGVDVRKLAGSVLVGRAVERMWDRDPELKTRIDGYIEACQVHPAKDISSIVIGTGRADEVILVATGKFTESEIAICVSKSLEQDGGRLTTSTASGRDVYKADSGPDKAPVWFAFGSNETILVSSSEEYLHKSLGDGPKASRSTELAGLIQKARVDGAAVWVAGTVPPAVGKGLERASAGKASAPVSIYGHLRVDDGLGIELGAVMKSREDAKALVSFGKGQLDLGAMAAAKWGLTPVVRKLSLEAADSTVILKMSLTHDELADLLSRIDTDSADEQNPSSDAGTGAPSDDQADAAPGGE